MISLVVNDQERVVDVSPDTPLLYVLRNDLGMNGPKFGCGLGQCGACTVIMDGAAILSCVTPVEQAAGRNIVTLEGLGSAVKPHPIQSAFIEGQAAQCGYCINGMIMTSKALLDSRDWTTYPTLTFSEAPEVEVHLPNRPEAKPLGSGEASSGPTEAAIVNAASNVLGRRIRDLFLVPERIKAANG